MIIVRMRLYCVPKVVKGLCKGCIRNETINYIN